MKAVEEKVSLATGIEVDGVVHFDVTLRPATLEDTYAATAAVPIPENRDDKSARIAYSVRIDDAVVLSQICALGAERLDIPNCAELVHAVDPEDMILLREGAERVKFKQREARQAQREPHGDQVTAPGA